MDIDHKSSGGSASDQLSAAALAAKKAAAAVAARINALAGKKPDANGIIQTTEDGDAHPVYAEEITINDYPQKARWRVTNKVNNFMYIVTRNRLLTFIFCHQDQISQITEVSGAAITTRGSFFPPGKQPTGNERKLYLFIEGDSEMVVEKAKNEIKRILIEATAAQMEAEARGGGTGGAGRYQVV
jgi:ATP-dependent RNA helicase DDX46/PRP5